MRLVKYPLLPLAWAGLATLAALAGCAKPHSAGDIASGGGLTGAKQKAAQTAARKNQPANSTLIGSVEWVNLNDNIGVIRITGAAAPADTYLITRSPGGDTTKAILMATGTAGKHSQGVMLINGTPLQGDDVLIPGAQDQMLVDQSLEWNSQRQREAKAAFQAAGSAAPGVIIGE